MSDHEESSARRTDNSPSTSSTIRRTFVKGAALAGVGGLSLTTTGTALGSYTPHDDEYRTVVNVADAGADRSGGESITPVLDSEQRDDTLFYFPPGRYAMDSQFRFTDFDKFAVVGDGATIVPANFHDFDGPQYRLFRLGTLDNPGADLRFEGFEIDQRAPDTGIRAIEAAVTDRLEISDVRVRGYHDSGTWGPGSFNVVDPDGTGRVVDFRAEDGGAWTEDTPNAGGRSARGPVGIIANNTRGQLMFRRCHLDSFPGSGLYAVGGSGRIIVHGGLYRNSTAASIRIGGTDSVVRWPQVEVFDAEDRPVGQRGIRIERGDATIYGAVFRISVPKPNCHAISVMNTCRDAWIENTRVLVGGDTVNHGIVVSPQAGETTIVDTEIVHTAAGGHPLWIRDSTKRDQVLCEYLTIRGRAGDEGGFRDGIRCERDNARFVECDVEQPSRGDVERNALVNKADDVSLYRTRLRASKYPIVEAGSDASFLRIDASSYDDSREAVCLRDTSSGVRLRHSRIVNGVQDLGSDGLTMYQNTA